MYLLPFFCLIAFFHRNLFYLYVLFSSHAPFSLHQVSQYPPYLISSLSVSLHLSILCLLITYDAYIELYYSISQFSTPSCFYFLKTSNSI